MLFNPVVVKHFLSTINTESIHGEEDDSKLSGDSLVSQLNNIENDPRYNALNQEGRDIFSAHLAESSISFGVINQVWEMMIEESEESEGSELSEIGDLLPVRTDYIVASTIGPKLDELSETHKKSWWERLTDRLSIS